MQEESIQFWRKEVAKDEQRLRRIYSELFLGGEDAVSRDQMQMYKLELNLIGRDLVYASQCVEIDTSGLADKLNLVRSKLY